MLNIQYTLKRQPIGFSVVTKIRRIEYYSFNNSLYVYTQGYLLVIDLNDLKKFTIGGKYELVKKNDK